MRKLWIGTLLAPFVLSLTATKAAVEPSQEQITVLSSKATLCRAVAPRPSAPAATVAATRAKNRRHRRL